MAAAMSVRILPLRRDPLRAAALLGQLRERVILRQEPDDRLPLSPLRQERRLESRDPPADLKPFPVQKMRQGAGRFLFLTGDFRIGKNIF